MLGCEGEGGSIMAAEGLAVMTGAVDPDLRALTCAKANGLHDGVRLLRTAPSSQECKNPLVNLKSDVMHADGYRQYEENTGEISDAASVILETFASSEAHVIPIECTRQLLQTADWKTLSSPNFRKRPWSTR